MHCSEVFFITDTYREGGFRFQFCCFCSLLIFFSLKILGIGEDVTFGGADGSTLDYFEFSNLE